MMQLPYVNGGKPFVPKTTVRDLLDALRANPLTERENVETTLRFCFEILKRTDPKVTEELLLDLPPWELKELRLDLLRRPKEEALGEPAPPKAGAP